MKDILWISLGLAVAVPAILVPMASRRMLLPTAIAWLVSPVLVYAVLIARDLITEPAAKHALGDALYGLALLSPILAPPWLAACLVGFTLGFCFRWMTRSLRRKPRQAVTMSNPPAAEWRPVHIGFENDGLSINSVDVWAHKWRQQSVPKLRLAHITHPNQFHDYEVYTIGDDVGRVCFAACELSNGVWGFAVRETDLVMTRGYSHDNTLRYEHRVLAGGTGPASPVAVLLDTASGKVLADCGSWASSRIVANADGSLFIRLQQDLSDVVFRVDPAKREFWNHDEGGPRQRLAELGAAIEQARQAVGNSKGQATAVRAAGPGSARPVAVNPWAAWRAAVLIAAAAFVAIAGATFVSMQVAGSETTAAPLDRIPFPDLPPPRS